MKKKKKVEEWEVLFSKPVLVNAVSGMNSKKKKNTEDEWQVIWKTEQGATNIIYPWLYCVFFFLVEEFCEDRIFIYVVRLANLLGRCVLAQHVIGFLCYHI